MSIYLLAGFVAISVVWLGLHLRKGKGIKHIRGPASPSLLFGQSPVLRPTLFHTLTRHPLGHEAALFRQEEASSLEFEWMKEYGSTWRTRGVFGVGRLLQCSALSLTLTDRNSRARHIDGRPYDGGPEGMLSTSRGHSDPICDWHFFRRSSMCSTNPATTTPRRRPRTSWDTSSPVLGSQQC